MTPKEKAEDLLLKYSILKDGHNHLVKQCALIAVDEIIEYAERWGDMADDDIKEFKQVKTELTNL
jgi:hypothetical protein